MSAQGLKRDLEVGYDQALAELPAALQAEGFGVLTEIDVQATLKKKLAVDFRRYKILGACNPPFAHQALEADLQVGLVMPCNVVVYEKDDGKAVVMAWDPMEAMAQGGNAKLQGLAAEIRGKLSRVLERL